MSRSVNFAGAICSGLLCATPVAVAQHAGFVLFGEPSSEAAAQTPEQRFVHPITDPYFHEDSFVTSDVRAWYIYHNFPDDNIGGGDANLFAVQLRLALTDQIQFVAYKDGYLDFGSGLVNDDGWMDIGAGVKWNFLQKWDEQLHAAVGAGYEIAAGNGSILQNDDEWRLWASINKGFDELHLGATANLFIADDEDSGLGNSDHASWHLHADYWVCDWFSPVAEINGYHVLNEGFDPLPFQGIDVANLGGQSDEAVITYGIGAEVRPFGDDADVALRGAFEGPITSGDDLYGYRLTFSLVWSF